jgi:hypothetical protein
VDHLSQPLQPDNPVGQIDKQIAKLADLADLAARVEHARRLEAKAKGEWQEYVAAHFAAIVEALDPDAQAIAAAIQEKAAALAEEADAYLGLAKRVDGLRSADRRLQQVRVPAIDAGAELVRLTAGYRDVALPLPTELRYPGQP